jgi:hypothetical protein
MWAQCSIRPKGLPGMLNKSVPLSAD